MDDTQTQQPTMQQPADATMPTSMGDVAGMTPPPPAPVMPEPTPAASTVQDMTAMPSEPAAPAPTMPAGDKPAGDEDYSYAEDVLNEILDSLDRIEAKLDAMEKKG